MKIQIEVDLEPHEFDLANELLRTLNQLTQHVRVRRGSSQGGAAPQTTTSSAGGAPPAAAQVPAAVPVATPVPVAVPAAAAAPPAPATPQEARRAFAELLSRLGDVQQLDAVVGELGRVFSASALPPQQLQEEFLEAFFATAFDPKLLQPPQAELGVAPYMHVLPRLPEGVKDHIKSKVIAKVLGHLNQKRAAGASRREEFYLQADAFAVLSEMDFVGIDGAIQTIEKLLKNADKRAAAITTLGKTVERCRPKLGAANPAFLASLFNVLDGVTEPTFQYDIQWINNNMQRTGPQQAGAPVPAAAPAAAAPPAAASGAPAAAAPAAAPNRSTLRLGVSGTFSSPGLGAEPGSQCTFFTLGWDPTSQHLISGGRDVPVTVWGTDGRVVKAIDSPGMYVCCLDVELANQLVLMCGIYDPPQGNIKSRIAVYDGRPNQGFVARGDIMRAEVDMTAVVRALPGTPNLITGESVRLPNNAFQEQISLYDLNRVMAPGPSGPAIEPIVKFQDHKNLVTCLAPIGSSNPGVFVSGSRDFTVKLWDIRAGPAAVATMGVQANDFAATAHAEMVTCVDVSADGHMVLSGSLDQSLAAWDMRSLARVPLATAGPTSVCNQHGSQAQWSNHGILKACLEGSPLDKLAAVATVQGLYTVDFSTAVPIITAASALQPDGATPKQYNDIKWASKTGRLYASAGDCPLIDVLEIIQG